MRWNSQSISWPYVETFSGSHQLSMSGPRLLALLLHLEGDLGRLARLHLDLFALLAERFVPDVDLVLAWGHVVDLGHPIAIGHAEEGIRHDGHPAQHPAVHVAGQLDD